ncbi:E3 ubiquitin-protein ligase NRDP1-like [Oppia nitens]|uniref:E3 ubiquitin-protein ligase NRDP1-like n=1 Tax=Oppia nitens TaxID=1686743 RepID=UPI0023DAF584|nr:E3 ubiquitin-protein ligase NRDP1-like [Oppia nitens]
MGYDCLRFAVEVPEELMCSICNDVLCEPLVTECDHLFCRECITEWLSVNRTCPIDRLYITSRNLRTAPRYVRNQLGRQLLKCDFADDGCQTMVTLDSLYKHVNDCYYNPKKRLICQKGCERWMTREQLQNHNCWRDLRNDMIKQEEVIADLRRWRYGLIGCLIVLMLYILFPTLMVSMCFENLLVLMPTTTMSAVSTTGAANNDDNSGT